MRWFVPLLLALVVGSARSEPKATVWQTDLAAARKQAARENKPLLVAFRCVP